MGPSTDRHVTADHAMMETQPSACTPSSTHPPPRNSPRLSMPMQGSGAAKSPTASTPHAPAAPWTAKAPQGSSMRRRSRAKEARLERRAPSAPMTIDSQGVTTEQHAVMATSEPRMPVARCSTMMECACTSDSTIDAVAPAAAARIVVTATLAASSTPPPTTPKVEPVLKLNQLTQSTNVPNSSFTGSQDWKISRVRRSAEV
mmetsp:Transcript_20802/g.41916  ORF Transcript_20802/g.41916 Transcript_20802/m.41916 type:complete len:202 (-) Transcript_20802:25-630(-)